MYKIAICNDEESYRNKVKEIVLQYSKKTDEIAFYEYATGEELLANLWRQYDLSFLQIGKQGINGKEVAEAIRKENKTLVLVFCTYCYNPTPDLFKVRPYRYILKDLEDRMLKAEMQDILEEMRRSAEQKYLNVTSDGKLIRIPIKSILYISIMKRGASIHIYSNSNQPEVLCRESIHELYVQLAEEGFEYAHNSYIVNMANIVLVSKNMIQLKDHTELNISRSKQKQFDMHFSDFLCLRYKRK